MKLLLYLSTTSLLWVALLGEPVRAFSVMTRTSASVVARVTPLMKKSTRVPSVLGVGRSSPEPRNDKGRTTLLSEGQAQEDTALPMELVGLGVLLTVLTSFILVNQFVGPWPMEVLTALPPPSWLLLHYLGGVLFAGGIVVTTALEWLVVEATTEEAKKISHKRQPSNPIAPVLNFLFDRVPIMDAALVVPGLALALVSGVAVATAYYEGLATSPPHIVWAFRTLVAFAIWWAATDVATQGPAGEAIREWSENGSADAPLPSILYRRRLSNIGSCLFIVALYAIMALKPGL